MRKYIDHFIGYYTTIVCFCALFGAIFVIEWLALVGMIGIGLGIIAFFMLMC
jgi:hypothetical protein